MSTKIIAQYVVVGHCWVLLGFDRSDLREMRTKAPILFGAHVLPEENSSGGFDLRGLRALVAFSLFKFHCLTLLETAKTLPFDVSIMNE